jgi:NAD(P)-dependent dehydrogenase (short-subunit alcohol dehydrogenase family)
MVDYGLKDKVVLITGANHGIGAAAARAFAAEGASVLINYLRMPPLGTTDGDKIETNKLIAPGIAFYNAVNIVSPGPIQTGWITPELAETIARDNPLGRVGKPEDVADVIIFLASEQARWLTEQLF